MTTTPLEHLLEEHRALIAHYGRAQLRCSDLLAGQALQMERMQREIIRLRAQVIVRDTALAWEREDRAALLAAVPGLAPRRALARQVEALASRIQELAREVLHWQWRAGRQVPWQASASASAADPAPRAVPEANGRAVLCIAQDASGALVTQRMVESAEGLVAAQAVADALLVAAEDEDAALEASLVAADLVICQTGCVSHNAYWRVQDHCKRTGKPCVLVDQPQVMHFMREAPAARAGAAAALAGG